MINTNSRRLPDILIIDDDSTVVIALNRALNKIGRIRFASDAKQAFAMINESHPNLILLDVELPDFSGLEVCSKLKNNLDTENIPVLFITSHTEVGFEEKVFDVGAADYIVKPLNPRVVAARVQTHLDYHRVIRLLEELAHTDGMTGLANRRTFDEGLVMELKRSLRGKEPLTVVLVDIDEFKKYNDYFGHLAGDDCIKKIALSLGSSVRRSTDLVARYGGEEFAFVMPNMNVEDAGQWLAELLKTIEQLAIAHAPNATYEVVTISIGYSTLNPEKESAIDSDDWAIVKAADQALYESKQNGRNCISYTQLGVIPTYE